MIAYIELCGCDATTEFTMESPDSQTMALLETLAALSEAHSSYGCQPTMKVSFYETLHDWKMATDWEYVRDYTKSQESK